MIKILFSILVFTSFNSFANEFYDPDKDDFKDLKVLQAMRFKDLTKNSVLSFKKPIVIPKPSPRRLPNCSDKINFTEINSTKKLSSTRYCNLCVDSEGTKKREEALVTAYDTNYVVTGVTSEEPSKANPGGFLTISLSSPQQSKLNFICSGVGQDKLGDIISDLSQMGIELKVVKLKEASLNKKQTFPGTKATDESESVL